MRAVLYRFFGVFIFFFYLATPHYSQNIDTSSFYSNPILSRPTNQSVTISVLPKKALQVYYEYGTISGGYAHQTQVQNIAAETTLRTVLTNLNADTRYYYRIRYKTAGASQYSAAGEYKFYTQRAKGTTFTFTIEADPHLYDKKGGHALMRIALENQLEDNPDFMIDLGDTFGDDHNPGTITSQEMDLLHKNFIPYFGLLNHSAPLFLCLGNHEGENGYYLLQSPPNNLAYYGTFARKKYYANPVPDGFYTGNNNPENYGIGLPENYYGFEWGDALFVVLDVYRGYTVTAKPREWEWTLGKTQYDWFKQTLETSSAKYKFVFAHHILGETRGGTSVAIYNEWGGYEANGTTYGFDTNRPGWGKPIHKLMVDNKVNIFFQGHDHLYAKEDIDGMVYQEVPMPCDSTYILGMRDNGDAYSGIKIDGSGHLRVTVSPVNVKVDYIRAWQPSDVTPLHPNRENAYSYSVQSSVTPVEKETKLPTEFKLSQNYPNPFNPATAISFELPAAGSVSLKIYNSIGQEIKILADGFLSAGMHHYNWNASGLPSGVYFYQLRANGTVITKKAILLK